MGFIISRIRFSTSSVKGCFNEVAWDYNYGQPFTEEVENRILEMMKPNYIRGLTLLGGEPFDPRNQPAILSLLRKVKKAYPQKSIWAFSGYLFDRDILPGRLGDPAITEEYLSYLDVLVDGPFIEERKNLSLRFRGSDNQRLIDVPASLEAGAVVLWQDWQAQGKGM